MGATSAPSDSITRRLLTAAAFVLPALSLALPSGYSWGALLMVLAGIWTIGKRRRQPADGACAPLVAFGVAIAVMGAIWLIRLDIDWQAPRWNDFDRAAKYALALMAIPALCHTAPSVAWLRLGFWIGSGLAGLTAAWQINGLQMERASGYTNAIQFGDIALLLAAWSVLWWRQAHSDLARWGALAATVAGLYASFASGSRGGWVVVPLLLASMVWVLHIAHSRVSHPLHKRKGWMWMIAAVTLVVGLSMQRWTIIEARLQKIREEWTLFHEHGISDTSIGQRLAHWQLAWQLGQERPLIGWGEEEYKVEKQKRVDTGYAPPAVLHYGHAHNEWLDLWAKAGLLGVAALAGFYGVPLIIYWRALRQARSLPDRNLHEEQSLVAGSGLILVVGFIGFGLTQVMFAHNSGNMMYLFMNILLIGILQHLQPASHQQ